MGDLREEETRAVGVGALEQNSMTSVSQVCSKCASILSHLALKETGQGLGQPEPPCWSPVAKTAIYLCVCHDGNKCEEEPCCEVPLVRGPGLVILKEVSSHPYTWLSGSHIHHRPVSENTEVETLSYNGFVSKPDVLEDPTVNEWAEVAAKDELWNILEDVSYLPLS